MSRWSKLEEGYRAQGENYILEKLERLPETIQQWLEEERKLKELMQEPQKENVDVR